MSRAAQAADQSDPARNVQFRRWPTAAQGDDYAPIRSWHAMDLPAPPMSQARLRAERDWRKLTRGIAP